MNRIFLTYYLLAGHYYKDEDISTERKYFEMFMAAGKSIGIELQFQELIDSLDEDFVKEVCPGKKSCLNYNKQR